MIVTATAKVWDLRSPETEKILKEFRKNKQQLKERLESLKNRMKEQARFCKAAMIQRVPRVAAEILRLLDRQKLLGRNVLIVGTNALYAYEAAAGAFVETSITATEDLDILRDVRSRLTLVADNDVDQTGLLDILRKADRSFELSAAQLPGGQSGWLHRGFDKIGTKTDVKKRTDPNGWLR